MGFLTPGEVSMLWGQQQDMGTRFSGSKKGSLGPRVLLQLPHRILTILHPPVQWVAGCGDLCREGTDVFPPVTFNTLGFCLSPRSVRSATCISATRASCGFTCGRSTGPSPTPRCSTASPRARCLRSSPRPAEGRGFPRRRSTWEREQLSKGYLQHFKGKSD